MQVEVEGFEAPVLPASAEAGAAFYIDDGLFGLRVDVRGKAIDECQLLVFYDAAPVVLRPASSINQPTWPIDGKLKISDPEDVLYPITDAAKDGYLILDGNNVPWVRVSSPAGPVVVNLQTFTNGTPPFPVRIFGRWQLTFYDFGASETRSVTLGEPASSFED
ncbi:hypothetical protein [Brevundimonas sp.]|uniref:hypothetical protein n=1 Tax=Brevundimonas sp. TaxID=1871086 RepID=UPI003F6F8684